jgi:hypothetical protein
MHSNVPRLAPKASPARAPRRHTSTSLPPGSRHCPSTHACPDRVYASGDGTCVKLDPWQAHGCTLTPRSPQPLETHGHRCVSTWTKRFHTSPPCRPPTVRQGLPPLLVPGGTADPVTLGAAFDFAVRFVLDPNQIPEVALHGFRTSSRRVKAILGAIETARAASNCRDTLAPEQLLRAAWALALTTGISRGDPLRSSPLHTLGWRKFTSSNLLDLAPANALIQMQHMHAIARTSLYPLLPNPARRLFIGPTFAASRLCSADADLIIDGHLIDLKTRVGVPNSRTGFARMVFPAKTSINYWVTRFSTDRIATGSIESASTRPGTEIL